MKQIDDKFFISFSSNDLGLAEALRDWLGQNGFGNFFLDRDREKGIPVGVLFERALTRALQDTSVLLIVLTPNWLASDWCKREFLTAQALGKLIIPLFHFPQSSFEKTEVLLEILKFQGISFVADLKDPFAELEIRLNGTLKGTEPIVEIQSYYRGLRHYADRPTTYSLPGSSRERLLDWFVPLGGTITCSSDSVDRDAPIADGLPAHHLLSKWREEGSLFVVEGDAGAGKTTFLKYLAKCAMDFPEEIGLSRPLIPLVVKASDLASSPGSAIAERLNIALSNRGSQLTLSELLPDQFHKTWPEALKTNLLFLLDGFDEIDETQREEIAVWISGIKGHAPGTRLLVATRSASLVRQAFCSFAPSEYIELRLSSPNELQTKKIAARWLDDELPLFIHEAAEGKIRDIFSTPLGVALAATVFKDDRKLPDTKADLYEKYVTKIVKAAEKNYFKSRTTLTENQILILLENLALDEVKARCELNQREREATIRSVLLDFDSTLSPKMAEDKSAQLREEILLQSGLFTEGEKWRHLTFRDYFAARKLNRDTTLTPGSEQFVSLVAQAPDPFWDGALRFLFSIKNPGQADRTDETFWEPFREAFEKHIGQQPLQLPWWKRPFFPKADTKAWTGGIAQNGEDYARVAEWIAELGGAPVDIEEECLRGMVTASEPQLRDVYLNRCANIFAPSRKEPAMLTAWTATPRLRLRMAPWQELWMADLILGSDTAVSSAGLLFNTGGESEVVDAIRSLRLSTEGVKSLVQAVKHYNGFELAEKIGTEIHLVYRQRQLENRNTLSIDNDLPNFSFDPGSPFEAWLNSRKNHPFFEVWQIFRIVMDERLGGTEKAKILLQSNFSEALNYYNNKLLKWNCADSLSGIDIIFALSTRSDLEQFRIAPSVPENLQRYAGWWLENADPKNKMSPKYRFLTHLSKKLVDSVNAIVETSSILVTTYSLARRLGLEWLSALLSRETEFDHLRSAISAGTADLDLDSAAMASLEGTPEFICAMCEAWLEKMEKRSSLEAVNKVRELLMLHYPAVMERDPNWLKLLIDRGRIADDLKRHDDAINDYTKAIEANISLPEAYMMRGLAHSQANRHKMALADLDRAIEEEDSNSRIWKARGYICHEGELWREAIASLDRAAELIGVKYVLPIMRGLAKYELGMLEQAAIDFEIATIENKEDHFAIEMKILCSSACGDNWESIQYAIERGVELPRTAQVKNAFVMKNLDLALTVADQMRADGDYSAICVQVIRLLIMKSRGLPIYDEVVAFAQYEDDDRPTRIEFWAAVLFDDDAEAEKILQLLDSGDKESDLSWIANDYHVLASDLPPSIGVLAERAGNLAIGARKRQEAKMFLPKRKPEVALEAETEFIRELPKDQQQQLKKTLFPRGMLCGEARIGGYYEEYDLAQSILDSKGSDACLVIVPLLDSGHIYGQSNRKWDPSHNWNFKVCMNYSKACDQGWFQMVARRFQFTQIILTEEKMFLSMQRDPQLSTIRKLLRLEKRPLPYTSDQVIFE